MSSSLDLSPAGLTAIDRAVPLPSDSEGQDHAIALRKIIADFAGHDALEVRSTLIPVSRLPPQDLVEVLKLFGCRLDSYSIDTLALTPGQKSIAQRTRNIMSSRFTFKDKDGSKQGLLHNWPAANWRRIFNIGVLEAGSSTQAGQHDNPSEPASWSRTRRLFAAYYYKALCFYTKCIHDATRCSLREDILLIALSTSVDLAWLDDPSNHLVAYLNDISLAQWAWITTDLYNYKLVDQESKQYNALLGSARNIRFRRDFVLEPLDESDLRPVSISELVGRHPHDVTCGTQVDLPGADMELPQADATGASYKRKRRHEHDIDAADRAQDLDPCEAILRQESRPSLAKHLPMLPIFEIEYTNAQTLGVRLEKHAKMKDEVQRLEKELGESDKQEIEAFQQEIVAIQAKIEAIPERRRETKKSIEEYKAFWALNTNTLSATTSASEKNGESIGLEGSLARKDA